jgi:hypothetical protein
MNNSIFIQIKIIYDKWVCEKITEALQVNHKRIHCCKNVQKDKTKIKFMDAIKTFSNNWSINSSIMYA